MAAHGQGRRDHAGRDPHRLQLLVPVPAAVHPGAGRHRPFRAHALDRYRDRRERHRDGPGFPGLGPAGGPLRAHARSRSCASGTSTRAQIDTPWTNGKVEAFWAAAGRGPRPRAHARPGRGWGGGDGRTPATPTTTGCTAGLAGSRRPSATTGRRSPTAASRTSPCSAARPRCRPNSSGRLDVRLKPPRGISLCRRRSAEGSSERSLKDGWPRD